MIREEDTIVIGKFQKTHALKGELNAILDIDPLYFEEGNPMIILTDGILVPFFINSIREKGSTSYLIKVDGVDSEEEARHFVNKEIRMLKKDAEEWLDPDEEGDEHFIGFKLVDNLTGKVIGEIISVDDSTENILFGVETENSEEIFIPATSDFVESIDEAEKILRMNLPEGLLDING